MVSPLNSQNRELPLDRQMKYWRSLLTMKPTGNAMVDAGFHEEMRCALRDALHVIQDLSQCGKFGGERSR